MVLYVITLASLMEKLCAAAPDLLVLFYMDGDAFDGPVDMSTSLMTLLLEQGPDRGSLSELAKFLFICDSSAQEEAAHWSFVAEGLEINVVPGIRYLGAYVAPAEERGAWFHPQVEKWAEGVWVLSRVAKRHPQTAYAVLGMSLQLDWKDLHRNVPGVGALMDTIESALGEEFLSDLFGW